MVYYSAKRTTSSIRRPTSHRIPLHKKQRPLDPLCLPLQKTPHCLTLIRTFNHEILDLVELTLRRGLPMEAFEGPKPAMGNRPTLVFNGDLWETDEEFVKIKNSLQDLLGNGNGSTHADKVNLKGLDHVISVSVDVDKTIHFRTYMIVLKKSGTKLPKVELSECGPSFEFKVGRTRFADDAVYKQAYRVPKELTVKKVKNIERDEMGDKVGRVHMENQDFSKLQTRKMKGLKRGRKNDDDGEEGGDGEDAPEKPKKQPRKFAKKNKD
ncbi:Brix-domain-containing protein [Rhizoclosmatium globosum]|uniref:Ribosome production factor 2 homolog n=1 Tax=Rhizoclosmatium globosum TaxID=329046 RepID=A0A1Y2CBW6_9FUNG|nr:Brix-domain-containing protein [Rhizoclosmatium globosum]|eukprot:ORY44387.1 Brix-domain-containing protein [Rhizoclosmatium globosum]